MKKASVATIGLAFALILPLLGGGQVSKETLTSISTPDKVETRIGALEFKDGAPSKATLEKAYDHIDFTNGQRASMRRPFARASSSTPRASLLPMPWPSHLSKTSVCTKTVRSASRRYVT